MCVSIMRAEAGRDPHDRALQDLLGELGSPSAERLALLASWAARPAGTGRKVEPVIVNLIGTVI
jgi:hypothetical protein